MLETLIDIGMWIVLGTLGLFLVASLVGKFIKAGRGPESPVPPDSNSYLNAHIIDKSYGRTIGEFEWVGAKGITYNQYIKGPDGKVMRWVLKPGSKYWVASRELNGL